jgi:hypothetical protein
VEPAEKVAMVAEAQGPGVTAWRRAEPVVHLAAQGALAAAGAEEAVAPASDYRALQAQLRETQRLLGKKTMEAEILKEALEVAAQKKNRVARGHGCPTAHQVTFRALAFAEPLVVARERPDGRGRCLRHAIFRDEPLRQSFAHGVIDRRGMRAAQAEGFEKPLPDGGDIDPKLAHAVIDDGHAQRRMRRRLVLDDFEGAQPRALVAPSAEKQASVARRPEQHRARGRELGARIEVMRDAHGMPQHGRVDVVARIDIDATRQLDELAGLRAIVTALSIEVFADKV